MNKSKRQCKQDPGCYSHHQQDFSLLESITNSTPEWRCKVLNNRSNPRKKSSLCCVHSQLLEINTHQWKQGSERGKEEKIKHFCDHQPLLSRIGKTFPKYYFP